MRVRLQSPLGCARMKSFGREQSSEKWATPTFLNNGLVAVRLQGERQQVRRNEKRILVSI